MANESLEVEIEDGFDSLDYNMKKLILKDLNRGMELRAEVDRIVGLDTEHWMNQKSPQSACLCFSKGELAELVLALGGPQ